jgi:hypothetical protein
MSTTKVFIVLGTTALAAILVVTSLTTGSIVQGQGTDLPTDLYVPSGSINLNLDFGTDDGSTSSQPPASTQPPTTIDQPTGSEGAQVPTSAEAPAATQLPAAGSAGLLNGNGGVQTWLVLMALGAAFLAAAGGLSTLRFHKR